MSAADSYSNHASWLAANFNAGAWGYLGKPVPEGANLDGDGDLDSGPKPSVFLPKDKMHFEVLGKAQPVVADQHKPLWETELGTLAVIGNRAYLQLTGTVSTSMGLFKLGAELITEDIEFAKKMIGIIPNEGPGTGVQMLEQAAGGQIFTWEAGTGWVTKGMDPSPIYASGTWPSKVSSWPEDGAQHTGPDGAIWEFQIAGGWIIKSGPDTAKGRATYGWWCSACSEHWNVHKGDPVGCESGGWLRPATSAEHKRAILAQGA